ncbi:LysR family transcriptional regulator [Anaerovibrio lipolyticus]|uniref:LysR family transcriptional regulator n=1 Tax=Anaerovibrio lipolyticus TaxID=82374 RepID=UPI0026EF17A4|nr:LysR family transcriptional regulator [Anaerovibrio lipolyticus]MBE6106386.1 LysR family transcriptional regulator [Anaerovibrio lipolyticus]
MELDIRVLKYFLAVAKVGNITQAARDLHITQPTLSRQLMDLEKNLGTELFVRKHKQLTLSDSGFLFQQRAKEIVQLADKACRELSEQKSQMHGTVTIACVESIASCLLPEIMAAFSQNYPYVKYELYSADGNDIREKIDRGNIDLGILLEPVEVAKYNFLRLPCYEKWGVAMREDSPLARKDVITTEDIQGLPIIIPRRTIVIEEISRWLEVAENRLNIVASHNLPTNGLLLAKKGIGYLICVEGSFTIRPMTDLCFRPFLPERTTGHVLVWKKNHVLSKATMRFLEFVRDKYEKPLY